MFERGGFAYVYLIYGRNWWLNATAEFSGSPAAVLIRAIQPRDGLASMFLRRSAHSIRSLTNGPGKLTEAFGIDGSLNATDLTAIGPLFICGSEKKVQMEVVTSRRVGVTKGCDFPWRFHIKGNPFVS